MPLVYAQAFFLFFFYPQQDCVMYLSGTGVIEMWPSSLPLFWDLLQILTDSPILSSGSGSFGAPRVKFLEHPQIALAASVWLLCNCQPPK